MLLDGETNETNRPECLEEIENRDLTEIPGGVGIVSKLSKPIMTLKMLTGVYNI